MDCRRGIGLAKIPEKRMDRPKVLYLVDQLGRGGAAQVVVHSALSLDRYSPVVCTTRAVPPEGMDDLLRGAGIPLIELDRTSRIGLMAWRRLWTVLPGVSILHSHESGSNFWGRVWGRLFRVPVIVTQDHTAADEKPLAIHILDRLLSRLSDRIVTVSEFDRTLSIRHERLPPQKVVTIYNGIDPARFDQPLSKQEARRHAELPTDGKLIAVIARLAEQKNHQVLFEALDLLSSPLRAVVKCLVIGAGPLESDLRELVRAGGLGRSVSFLGERPDVPSILKAIDLLVLPSRWECLPVIILEALAARTPIVATAVGGVPEVLNPLEWPLVPPGDPAALADAITQVLEMPESRRDQIAQAGRRRVEGEFTRKKAALEVQDLYDSLLGNE